MTTVKLNTDNRTYLSVNLSKNPNLKVKKSRTLRTNGKKSSWKCKLNFMKVPSCFMNLPNHVTGINDRGGPAVSYKWTNWVREITGWSSSLVHHWWSLLGISTLLEIVSSNILGPFAYSINCSCIYLRTKRMHQKMLIHNPMWLSGIIIHPNKPSNDVVVLCLLFMPMLLLHLIWNCIKFYAYSFFTNSNTHLCSFVFMLSL